MQTPAANSYYLRRLVRSQLMNTPNASPEAVLEACTRAFGMSVRPEMVLALYEDETRRRSSVSTGASSSVWVQAPLYLVVGWVTIFAVMSAMMGPGNVISTMVIGVVCTAGVGGLVLLAASWIVGWMAVSVFRAVRSGLGFGGGS